MNAEWRERAESGPGYENVGWCAHCCVDYKDSFKDLFKLYNNMFFKTI